MMPKVRTILPMLGSFLFKAFYLLVDGSPATYLVISHRWYLFVSRFT